MLPRSVDARTVVTPRPLGDQDNARPNEATLPGGLDGAVGAGKSRMEARAQLVGRQLHPGPTVPALVGDSSGGAEHGDHTGDTEDLGPPHEHLR